MLADDAEVNLLERRAVGNKGAPCMLSREEYIEQAFFFGVLAERLALNLPVQELLVALREEVLSTTKLPLAIDFMLAELLHQGVMSTAMERLSHYFTPFQSFVMSEAENDRGRFDLRVGLQILHREADYRSANPTRPGLFMFQFETLCRNRLRYDHGFKAMSEDPFFDPEWQAWILTVRRQIGIVDFADLVYVRSDYYIQQQRRRGGPEADHAVLFGEKEGRIALANRRKDPLLLLAALQRQLGYPSVPRVRPVDDKLDLVPQLVRRVERLETRLKLLEEEQREGIDLTRFYGTQ
jgi:hypothetical protein